MENDNSYVEQIFGCLRQDYGIILSYGESNDIIPVGTFGITRYLNTKRKPYDTNIESTDRIDDILVELKKIDVIDDKLFYTSSDVIYLPLPEFLKMHSIADSNSSEFYDNLSYDATLESLKILEGALSDYLIHSSNLYPAQTRSLDNLAATYICNGQVMGNNYGVAPFLLGRVRILEKTLDYEDHKDDERETVMYNGRTR